MAAGGGDKKSGTQKIADPSPDAGEAREKAANAVGANHTYVSEAKKLAKTAQDVAKAATAPTMTPSAGKYPRTFIAPN